MKHRREAYCSHEALVSRCQLLIGCNRHVVNAHKLDASCHHPVSTILCQGSVVRLKSCLIHQSPVTTALSKVDLCTICEWHQCTESKLKAEDSCVATAAVNHHHETTFPQMLRPFNTSQSVASTGQQLGMLVVYGTWLS